MFNDYTHPNYRRLTEEEAEAATQAIIWLKKQHLNASQIATLTDRWLDREAKVIYYKIETKHIVWYRKIRYQDSPFDYYLSEVLPCLQVKRWIFPGTAWCGKGPSYGFHVRIHSVQEYLESRNKKILIKLKQYDTMKLSIKGLHFQKIEQGRKAMSL